MTATSQADKLPTNKVQQQTAAAVRIHKQLARRDDARERAHREQERPERLVAELVSADPASPTWYLRPGTLTVPQTLGAASITELQLHRLMERHRAAQAPQKAGARRRRPTAAAHAARR